MLKRLSKSVISCKPFLVTAGYLNRPAIHWLNTNKKSTAVNQWTSYCYLLCYLVGRSYWYQETPFEWCLTTSPAKKQVLYDLLLGNSLYTFVTGI